VGWLIPFGVPLTLIGDSPEQLGQARRQLARIGYDDLARDRRPGDVVLDVRRPEERADGALPQSLAVPLHELPGRLGQLPAGRIWVHCASGFRAGIAASLLAEAGRDVIQLDDHIDRARALGLLAP
jgi:rhodanese-related sulfurtransferase